jgi:hypothetical protein
LNPRELLFTEGIKNCVVGNGHRAFFETFRVNPGELSPPEIFGNCRICDRIRTKEGNKSVMDGLARKSSDDKKHAD